MSAQPSHSRAFHPSFQGVTRILFSAALCRGLIEARPRSASLFVLERRFPRLYAAASLKLHRGPLGIILDDGFSAALCRGLIEARRSSERKAYLPLVFRGFMPRPH